MVHRELDFAVHDLFCDGAPKVEVIGVCARVTWFVTRETSEGTVRVPVIALVMPNECLKGVAYQIAAGALLAPDDNMGRPVGNG